MHLAGRFLDCIVPSSLQARSVLATYILFTFFLFSDKGGWNAGSGKYSLMAEDPVKRATFIASVIPFLQEYGFEGIDLDWEYPGTGLGTHNDTDHTHFDELLDELKAALDPHGLLLTIAVSAGKDKIDLAYDVPYIFDRITFANVMTYDFHGWFPPTHKY